MQKQQQHLLKVLFAALLLWIPASLAKAQPLVTADWLSENLGNDNLVVIDLRNQIDEGSYETFLKGHIPGAVHSDYLKDGWRVARDGVPGLLPSDAEFEALVRPLGVSNNSQIVLIPAGVSSTDFGSSARAYWTFKVFGHEAVSILDGGWQGWQKAYPDQIATGAPQIPAPGNFNAVFDATGYIDTAGVSALVDQGKKSGHTLLDGRTAEQYNGEGKHGKAREAGRIPGAVNLFQAQAYNAETNRLKSKAELQSIYGELGAEPVVSYCNTGHWAATNWFVLSEVLGQKDVYLYDGSMVEWTVDPNRPLKTQSNLDKLLGIFKSKG